MRIQWGPADTGSCKPRSRSSPALRGDTVSRQCNCRKSRFSLLIRIVVSGPVHVPAVRSTHPINDYLQQRQSIVAVGHSHHTITSGALPLPSIGIPNCCRRVRNTSLHPFARSKNPRQYEPTPTGVTISCIVDLVSSAVDRPASVLWTSIMSFARSVGVVHSPAAACSSTGGRRLKCRSSSARRAAEALRGCSDTRFARDSPLEGDGFEPWVPQPKWTGGSDFAAG